MVFIGVTLSLILFCQATQIYILVDVFWSKNG